MTRHRLDHPTRPTVHCYYGYDHMLDFFVEIFRDGRDKPIKQLDIFSNGKPVTLIDCLDFMASNAFFGHEDLEDALLFMQDEAEHGTDAARRVVEVIERFRK